LDPPLCHLSDGGGVRGPTQRGISQGGDPAGLGLGAGWVEVADKTIAIFRLDITDLTFFEVRMKIFKFNFLRKYLAVFKITTCSLIHIHMPTKGSKFGSTNYGKTFIFVVAPLTKYHLVPSSSLSGPRNSIFYHLPTINLT
jgi:hypothetical protein